MSIPFETNELEIENGLTLKLSWFYESFAQSPWEQCELSDRFFTGKWEHRPNKEKRPYECLIAGSKGSFVVYNFADAVANLRKQGLSGELADKEARREVKWLEDWFNDKWYYATLIVECEKLKDFDPISVGCYEYPYHREEAETELIVEAKSQIDRIQSNFKPDFYPLPTA
jgi:hypothetical protein